MDDNKTSVASIIFSLVVVCAICWLICAFGTYLICLCFGFDWHNQYGTALLVALMTLKTVSLLLD